MVGGFLTNQTGVWCVSYESHLTPTPSALPKPSALRLNTRTPKPEPRLSKTQTTLQCADGALAAAGIPGRAAQEPAAEARARRQYRRTVEAFGGQYHTVGNTVGL